MISLSEPKDNYRGNDKVEDRSPLSKGAEGRLLEEKMLGLKKYLVMDEAVLEQALQSLTYKSQRIGQLQKWLSSIDSGVQAKQLSREIADDDVILNIEAALQENRDMVSELFGPHPIGKPRINPFSNNIHQETGFSTPNAEARLSYQPSSKTETPAFYQPPIMPSPKQGPTPPSPRLQPRNPKDTVEYILTNVSSALAVSPPFTTVDAMMQHIGSLSSTMFNQNLILKTAISKEESMQKGIDMVQSKLTKALDDKSASEAKLIEFESKARDLQIELTTKNEMAAKNLSAGIEWEKREKEFRRDKEEWDREKKRLIKENEGQVTASNELKERVSKLVNELGLEKEARQEFGTVQVRVGETRKRKSRAGDDSYVS